MLSPGPLPARSVFLEERLLKEGAFSDGLEADAAELRTLMGLGAKQAGEIEADVKQAAYKCAARADCGAGGAGLLAAGCGRGGQLLARTAAAADRHSPPAHPPRPPSAGACCARR